MTSVRLSGLSSRSTSSTPMYSSIRRGTSVYGGAGGRNVRVSTASNGLGSGFDLSQALSGTDNNNFSVSGSEKATMQNLNDRLAAYLDKVRTLEAANEKLERQIREWYGNKTPTQRDYSKHQTVIEGLREKIFVAGLDNARLLLHLDNAKLAAEDFKTKFESEQAACTALEMDIAGLRKVLDELTMNRSDLEMQIEGLKEELIFLKKNHMEDLAAMRHNATEGSVIVEVDAKPQEDLSKVMQDIRIQYESINEKNRREMEGWYKGKFEELNKQVSSSSETLQTSRSEISELKRTLQALEIELQSALSMKSALEGQLNETNMRTYQQISQLQMRVDTLENDLALMKANIEQQSSEYQMLLDIKTRLEMEIAEYRRLLDGEQHVPLPPPVKVVEVKKEVEIHKPVISRRTKVVIEELVDGKVVSRTEEGGTEVNINTPDK